MGILGYLGVCWGLPEYLGVFWGICELFWGLPGYPAVSWGILGSPRVSWGLSGYLGISRGIWGSPGVSQGVSYLLLLQLQGVLDELSEGGELLLLLVLTLLDLWAEQNRCEAPPTSVSPPPPSLPSTILLLHTPYPTPKPSVDTDLNS